MININIFKGGRDWLLGKYDYVHKDKVRQCLDTIGYLCKSRSTIAQRVNAVVEDIDEFSNYGLQLCQNCWMVNLS